MRILDAEDVRIAVGRSVSREEREYVRRRYPQTHFLLFDRDTLAPRGSFRGEVTAHTDGIALHAATTATFPAGALFAVHDDKAVAAFDLGEVARVLALDPDCTR